MCSVVRMFPSSVQFLGIYLGNGRETRLTKDISVFILNWVTGQEPPQVTDLICHGVPDGATQLFPSLETLDLIRKLALEWLSLFKAAKNRDLP